MDSTIHYKTDQGVNPKSDSMLESLLSSTNIPDMRAPIDTIDIKVSFSKGLWQDSSAMFAERINYLGHDKGISVSVKEIEDYLLYLLAQRVFMTTGLKYNKNVSYLYVPSLYALALLQIGKAYDKELGINYLPVFEGETITYEEAQLISNKLVLLQDQGFPMVRGLPRDRKGTVEFLLFQFASNQTEEVSTHLVSPDSRPHLVYAMLMSFFKVEQVNSIFTPRVKYGMANEYHQLLRSLINVGNA